MRVSVEPLLRHIQPALRGLIRDVRFTIAVVLTLGIGLGASIAALSAGYGVLIKPLPFRAAERIALVRAETTYAGTARPVRLSIGAERMATWNEGVSGVGTPAFYAMGVAALAVDGGSEILDTAIVSGQFFSVLDGPMITGRTLGPDVDALPAAVISARLAVRLFGSPGDALGKSLNLTSRIYSVVGVARGDFDFPTHRVDAWLPLGISRAVNPRCCDLQAIVRLGGGQSIERATEAARRAFLATDGESMRRGGLTVSLSSLPEDAAEPFRPALIVLMVAAGLLLLAACGNVVNLLLARNASREREFAIRRSLGASTRHLVMQLAVEGALLSFGAAMAGMVLTVGCGALMSQFAGSIVPRTDLVRVDGIAWAIALALSAIATIGTTLIPALRAARVSIVPGRAEVNGAGPFSGRRTQQAMCALQLGMAMTLLTGAAVLGRSLSALMNVDLGVSAARVATVSLNLSLGPRPMDAAVLDRVRAVIDALERVPGVDAVGVGTAIPPHLARMQVTLRRPDEAHDYRAAAVPATPGYFEALRMRLVRGDSSPPRTTTRHRPS
ncbi:MAG: ABC transporter permease [Vicinamibacteria bacterium]